MLYIICPTCSYFLGQVTGGYEEKKKEICNNPELSTDEKALELSKLILSLKLPRPCCKMRMMTYVDTVNLILPVQEDTNTD